MALELRGCELPLLGCPKGLLTVSNARLYSHTIKSHPHPRAEAQAFVLLKRPRRVGSIVRARDRWLMESIPPGFHLGLPYTSKNGGGAQRGRGLQSSWGNRLLTDGTVREQYRQMPWERVLETRETHFRQRPPKGQEGSHAGWVPEGPAVAWPDYPAADDDDDDDEDDDDIGQVELGAGQQGS